MIADGVPNSDIAEAEAIAKRGDQVEWLDLWMAKADEYESIAEDALTAGNTISGGEWMWHASLSAHYAQFMWFHDPERREAGQRRKVELYDRAAPHFISPGERIEVEVDGATIPGYLRLPEVTSSQPPPCVILIGGLESTKEESYRFEGLCLDRGLATFAFDGPGQGEAFFDVKLVPDFERYTSAVIDRLERHNAIDPKRLGILGRSLGGHYAPKSAAADSRLKACCAWGACFDLESFDSIPPTTQAGFRYVTGIEDPAEAEAHLRRSLNLAPVAAEMRRPLLVTHGRHDVIFGMDQVEKFRQHFVNAELEIEVDEEGDHCSHNRGQFVRPRMADWMANQLGARR